jgi:hypothetical protein
VKLLYLSCHGVLEADELRLFRELGHAVFSPTSPQHADPADLAAWEAVPCPPGADRRDHLTREFFRRFDAVIVMHEPRWVVRNAAALSGRRVVWRTIGQSYAAIEAEVRPYRRYGLVVVRCSPRERGIPGYVGGDAVIRFGKDPAEFGGWTGEERRTLTVNAGVRVRAVACNYAFYSAVAGRVPHRLVGPHNDGLPNAVGAVSPERLRHELRVNRAYLCVGSYPAGYTLNFVEAWMTGIPVVAVGRGRGNSPHLPGQELYEVPDLVENGVNGCCTDDPDEAVRLLTALLDDHALAARVGAAGRAAAIRHFGIDQTREGWRRLLARFL